MRDLSYGRPEGHLGPQIATGARMDVVRAVRRTCTSEPAGTATTASPSGRSVVAASSNRAGLRHGRRSALNQCLVPLIAVYHHEIGCLWPARPESTALTVTQIGPIRRRRDHAGERHASARPRWPCRPVQKCTFGARLVVRPFELRSRFGDPGAPPAGRSSSLEAARFPPVFLPERKRPFPETEI